MPRTAQISRLATALLVSLAAPLALADAPTPEAFGALPAESDVVLSPDGHWLAWLDHKEAKPRVIIFDVAGRKMQRILAAPERAKLRSIVWNDNETLLTVVSETSEAKTSTQLSREYFRTIAQDVTGGTGRMLPANYPKSRVASANPPLANLIAYSISKPHTVIMATGSFLMEVDTRTGLGTVIKVGNQYTSAWVVDRDVIVYGTGDGVVPNAQSQQMVHALSAAGKSVRAATLQGEDHWLSLTATRVQVLTELDAFLKEHL